MNVENLIARDQQVLPTPIRGCGDQRDIDTVASSPDPNDHLKVFMTPKGWYMQEPRFVPRVNNTGEDDGWLLACVFDELSQLRPNREVKTDAESELWIMTAKTMTDVVAKIRLPQRVPYSLHGNWISEEEIEGQRPIERLRSMPSAKPATSDGSLRRRTWMVARKTLEVYLE